MQKTFTFTVNGQRKSVTTDPDRPLLEVLREDLQLTGTKFGCREGQCGACTVLIGGKPALSCITTIEEADQQTILTIEGLAKGEKLHPVQQAFIDEGASQCGYCTPGMILAATALIQERSNPTDAEISAGMNKHICRCNGYVKIHKAIKRAAASGEVKS